MTIPFEWQSVNRPDKITPPEKRRYRASNEALTRDQVRALINGCNIARDQLMLIMGIFSGCRVNELTTLRLDKLDFMQDTITVWDDKKHQWTWKINEKGKKVRDKQLTEGKWRRIGIPHNVMQMLKKYIEQNPSGNEYVWNLSWVTWNRIIHKWSLHCCGVYKSWHCLRHTFVSLHQSAGTPISFVKAQTGDSATTILKVYDNPNADMIRENAEKRLF